VTEQVTYRGHSRPFTLELDGKGVAESVGVNSLFDLGFAREPREQMADVALIDLAALQGAEDGDTAVNAPLPSCLDPAGKERSRSDIDAHDSSFVALAVLDDDRPGVKINVFRPQG
jgi:hypothetical protein